MEIAQQRSGGGFLLLMSVGILVCLFAFVRVGDAPAIKEWMLSQDWTFFSGPLP